MDVDKILVTVFGFVGMVFTYWFFFMKKEREIKISGDVEIVVKGGYSPNVVVLPLGKTTKVTFVRKDTNSCLEEVVLPDFKIKRFLPLGERVTFDLIPKRTGEFGYSCGMGMFHGKIIVHD